MGSPAIVPDNVLTQFMDRVGEINATAGKPAGRMFAGAASASPSPSVQSADMRAEPETLVPVPLSPEEVAERDAKARAIGILPPLEDDGGVGGSFEEAALLSAPISRPVERLTAREFLAREEQAARRVSALPLQGASLPDFERVQWFNLERGVISIDGMEFPVPSADIAEMKAYAVNIALDFVVMRLAKALQAFGLPQGMIDAAAAKLKEGASDKEKMDNEGSTSHMLSVRESGHISGADSGSEVSLSEVSREEVQRESATQSGEDQGSGTTTGTE